MAEDGQKRDPKTHRTPKQDKRRLAYQAEYNKTPKARKARSEANKARRMLGLKVGDPRDAHHKTPLRKGGKTTKSNVTAKSRSKNRGWNKTS